MNESKITQILKKQLKSVYPEGCVLKLSDRFTAGIPDLCLTADRRTLWLEVKYLRQDSEIQIGLSLNLRINFKSNRTQRLFSKPQLATLRRLEHAGHAKYLIFAGQYFALTDPSTIEYYSRNQSVLFLKTQPRLALIAEIKKLMKEICRQ